jgi:osmotically-inducible protein OsmY
MRNPGLPAWAFFAVLAAFCSGCTSLTPGREAETRAKPAVRARGEEIDAGEPVSNESVGFEIRRRLNDDPVATAGIIVEVDEGKVTLRGVAPNLAAAWRAEAAARSVKGVKQVVNQILVAGTGR